jgi:hypothetical protein
MSEQEQNLIRLAAWDNYLAAKRDYQAQKQKLMNWGTMFSRLGKGLSENPVFVTEDWVSALPRHQMLLSTVREFQEAIRELKRTCLRARDFNWPVGTEIVKEIGPF